MFGVQTTTLTLLGYSLIVSILFFGIRIKEKEKTNKIRNTELVIAQDLYTWL